MNQVLSVTAQQQLEQAIGNALKKLGATQELTLCHYIPGESGGYIHHFTMRKMKRESPKMLLDLINQYILEPKSPKTVPPKARAARGSRKRKDSVQLNRNAVEKLLYLARNAGDREAIALLLPERSLGACKRELTRSIRENRVDHTLWTSYSEMIHALENAKTDA